MLCIVIYITLKWRLYIHMYYINARAYNIIEKAKTKKKKYYRWEGKII